MTSRDTLIKDPTRTDDRQTLPTYGPEPTTVTLRVNGTDHTLEIEPRAERVNPLGVKGIGELGIVGVAAAIANAVYHATGVRVRELPIRPEKLLAAS